MHTNHSQQRTGNGRSRRTEVISQNKMRRLLELDALAADRGRERCDLIRLVEAGAGVEAGELQPSLDLVVVNIPTWVCLEQCVDPEVYAHIRKVYKGPTHRYLHITDIFGNVLR